MPSPDRLAHPPEAAELAGPGTEAIDGLKAAGLFPRRVPLPGGGHAWPLSQVIAWAEDRRHRHTVCGVAMRP